MSQIFVEQATPRSSDPNTDRMPPLRLSEFALAVLRELTAIQQLVQVGSGPDACANALQKLMLVLPPRLFSLLNGGPKPDSDALLEPISWTARRSVSVGPFDCPSTTQAALHTGLYVLQHFDLSHPFAWDDRAQKEVIRRWPWMAARLFDDGTKLVQQHDPLSVDVGDHYRLAPLLIDFQLSSSDLEVLRLEVEAEAAAGNHDRQKENPSTRNLSPKRPKKWWAEYVLLCGRNPERLIPKLSEQRVYYEVPDGGKGMVIDLNDLTADQRQRYDRLTKADPVGQKRSTKKSDETR